MKLALVNPRVEGGAAAVVPFNLLYLATYVHDIAEVVIVDEVQGKKAETELKRISADLVGITVLTPTAYRAYEIADFVRHELGVKVVLGGKHVSALPQEGLLHSDFVVVGEGEEALAAIIKGEKREGVVMGTALRDIDLPIDWKLVDLSPYILRVTFEWPPLDHIATMVMFTSRGCPFRCVFCYNGRRAEPVRFCSAKKVLSDIDAVKAIHPEINTITFADDEFLIDRRRLPELLAGLNERGMPWGCQARATSITQDMAKKIAWGGCASVGIGFESGSQRILDVLKCGSATVGRNREAVRVLKANGIMVLGSFILGTPSETREEMEETLSFIIDEEVDAASVNNLTPYPSAQLWHDLGDRVKGYRYDLLLPSSDPSIILCDTMPSQDYKRFLAYACEVAAFKRGIRAARLRHEERKLLSAFDAYFMARHPLTAMKVLRAAW